MNSLRLFQDDKCTRPINGPTSGIVEKTCAPTGEEIALCSFYKGSIDVKFGTTTSLQIYSHGCYDSLPANVPSNGCHNRNHINEDKSILQHVLSEVFTVVEVVSFKGEVCLCSDTYCQTSGKTSGFSSEFGSACLVFSVLSVLLVLLMH